MTEITFLTGTRVRAFPRIDAPILATARTGEIATLLNPKPVKADSHSWWNLKHSNGTVGWSARSSGGTELFRIGAVEFDNAIAFTLFQEGGFQNRREDAGNWTGGEVGKGILKGTKFGISAASYPNLDIVNLTEEQARKIYYEDYWLASSAFLYPYPKYIFMLDISVVSGVGRAKVIEEMTPIRMLYDQYMFYAKSSKFNLFGAGWIRRNTALLGMLE